MFRLETHLVKEDFEILNELHLLNNLYFKISSERLISSCFDFDSFEVLNKADIMKSLLQRSVIVVDYFLSSLCNFKNSVVLKIVFAFGTPKERKLFVLQNILKELINIIKFCIQSWLILNALLLEDTVVDFGMFTTNSLNLLPLNF